MKVHIQSDASLTPLCNSNRVYPLATILVTTTAELKVLLNNNPPTPVCKRCIACWTAQA